MSILGIVTEYNPFHYGHLYHLLESQQKTKSTLTICVMNGNFVQRGRPALLNKWARTKMALKNGVDLIIELPLFYGIRSAEYFALGAVNILNACGIVDYLAFGSETGNIKTFKEIAQILITEKPYFKKILNQYLTKGYSFPKAREMALVDYLKKNNGQKTIKLNEIVKALSLPNNILGIEYIKALIKLKSTIKPVIIKRSQNNYHKKELTKKIASATAIRHKITQNNLELVKDYVPKASWEVLSEEYKKGRTTLKEDLFDTMILTKLRKMKAEELANYPEINNGLENRIIKAAYSAGDLQNLIKRVKTKAFTWTRIQRDLLYILLELNKDKLAFLDNSGPQYLRILGFNKKGENILKMIKERSSLPIVTQPAKYLKKIDLDSSNPFIKSLSYDIMASNIYSLLYSNKNMRLGNLDFTTPIIKY